MFTAKIQNAQGNILVLTQNESQFQLFNIDGIDQPTAAVNFTNIATLDGSKYNSSKLNNRNIVLYIRINGDVERNRHILYSLFRSKEKCTFYYANDTVDVYIDGYVESVLCPLFTNSEVMQISILCPYPYFKSIDGHIVEISKVTAGFTFPFSIPAAGIPFSTYDANGATGIVNNSQNELGLLIRIKIIGGEAVSGIKIINTGTGEFIYLQTTFAPDDEIVINTQKGNKSAVRIRSGVTINIFSEITIDSTLFQLPIGLSRFTYTTGSSGEYDQNVEITFEYTDEYRGV